MCGGGRLFDVCLFGGERNPLQRPTRNQRVEDVCTVGFRPALP